MAQTEFNGLVNKLLELDKAFAKTSKSIAEINNQIKQTTTLSQKVNLDKKLNTQSAKLVTTTKQLNTAKKQASKLNDKAIREADKITQSLDLELQTKRQLIKIDQRLVTEQAKVNAELKKFGSIEAKSIKDLQRKNNALVKYRNTLSTTGKEFKNVTKQIRLNERQLKKHDKQIGRNQRNVGNYGSAFKGLIGKVGAFIGIYGVIRAVGGMIRIFKDFEKSSKKLQAILGVTANDMKLLTVQAKNLGSVTAFTASEILGLQTELAKLGFTLPQIEASTEGILALAAATGTELADAATLAGASIRIFGLDASEAGRVADVLALSTSKSALDMTKLSTALPIVGTTAKQAGLNIEQTTALLGTLADRGIDASTAGTSLRNIFLELSKKGLTFNEAMEMINNSTDKSKTSMDLFGKRSATAGVILSETGEITRELELALNDASGAAQEMADVMLDNLAGDITIAKSAWEGFVLSIESGDGVISTTLRGVISGFTKLLNKLKELNDFNDIISTKARKIADKRVEDFKIFIENVNAEEKKRRVSIRLYELERDIAKEKNYLEENRWKLFDEKGEKGVQNQIDIVNALEREKKLLINLGQIGFFDEQTESVIENTDALDENTDGLKNNKKEREEILRINNAIIAISDKGVDRGITTGGEKKEKAGASIFTDASKEAKGAFGSIGADAATFNDYLNTLFDPEAGGTLLGRIFGGGESGQAIADATMELYAQVWETINAQTEEELRQLDELLSKQDEAIAKTQEELQTELARIQELKTADVAFDTSKAKLLEEDLKRQKKARDATAKAEIAAKKKAKRRAIIAANIDIAASILKVFASIPPPASYILAAIQGVLGALQLAAIKSQKFAKGTESVQDSRSPSGIDTVPAMLTKNEGVISEPINKNIPYNKGFKHYMIPAAADMYLNRNNDSNVYINNNGEVVDRLDKLVENTSDNKVYDSNGVLRKEKKGRSTFYYN